MAIAFDASSQSNTGVSANPTSVNWNHTCSGSNRILIVAVHWRGSGSISNMNYNGVSMSNISSNSNGSSQKTSLWRLIAPATGTNTITINFTGTVNDACYGAISLTGVDQTSPIDNTTGSASTATSTSDTITTIADNAWIVGALTNAVAISQPSSSNGQTNVYNTTVMTNYNCLFGYLGPKTPAGAQAYNYSWGQSRGYAFTVASIAPAAATAVNSNFLMFM